MATQSRKPAPPADKVDPGNSLALVEGGQWGKFLARWEGEFAAIVPSHINVEAFVGMAAAYVRRDRNLVLAAKANPASLILALRECAALGHTPTKGIFSLVPYKSRDLEKNPGGWTITGIEEYRGVIERMYRAGGIQSVHVQVVRQHDRCRFQAASMVLPDHEYDEFADEETRGPLKAVYAWARMVNGGTSQVAWLTKSRVLKHRNSSRSGDAFWGPPWPEEGPWTEDMWMKTGLHKLEAFVPTSAAYRWEVARSEAAAGARPLVAGMPDRSPRDIHDAEFFEEEPQPQAETPAPPPAEQQESRTGWPATRRPPDAPPDAPVTS